MFTYPGGRVITSGYPIRALIKDAYGVLAFQVVGGPSWIDTDGYSIEARPPANSKSASHMPVTFKYPPPDEELLMFRTLLSDRFGLKFHEEMRDGPIFELVVARKGHRLTKAKEDRFPVLTFEVLDRPGISAREAMNLTMDGLASRLSGDVRRPVVNHTGLAGAFDFRVEYERNPNGPYPYADFVEAVAGAAATGRVP